MSVTLNVETFTATAPVEDFHGMKFETGTVVIVFKGRTETAKAKRWGDGTFTVQGFVGRYQTSAKAWKASVMFTAEGVLRFVNFGRDDRSGRFNKRNAISFEPETYEAL